jgi:hypothetical protein
MIDPLPELETGFKNTHSIHTHQWLEAPEEDKLMVKHKIVFPHGEPKS